MQVIIIKPVKKFLKSLEPHLKKKVYRHIGILKEYGLDLAMPFSKRLAKDLHELRILGIVNVRIFYTPQKDSIWLIHGFIKSTHKIPIRRMELGYKRLKDLTQYNL